MPHEWLDRLCQLFKARKQGVDRMFLLDKCRNHAPRQVEVQVANLKHHTQTKSIKAIIAETAGANAHHQAYACNCFRPSSVSTTSLQRAIVRLSAVASSNSSAKHTWT